MSDNMTLTNEEMSTIQQYRSRINGLMTEIGSLEVRKDQTLLQIKTIDQEASEFVGAIKSRLGIAEGAKMEISPEGVVKVLD